MKVIASPCWRKHLVFILDFYANVFSYSTPSIAFVRFRLIKHISTRSPQSSSNCLPVLQSMNSNSIKYISHSVCINALFKFIIFVYVPSLSFVHDQRKVSETERTHNKVCACKTQNCVREWRYLLSSSTWNAIQMSCLLGAQFGRSIASPLPHAHVVF